MSGWLLLVLLGAIAFGVARLAMRIDRGTLMLFGAALCVAAAGYAWQGSPGLAGAPRVADRTTLRDDTLFEVERPQLLRAYGETAQWLVLADGLARAGDDRGSAQVLATQVARHPRDVALAVGYAHALLVLADYNFTPAAALAFRRAERIEPANPAPFYFEGLARFEGRDLLAAERSWRALSDTLPARSPWRRILAERLRLFDMLRAQAAR